MLADGVMESGTVLDPRFELVDELEWVGAPESARAELDWSSATTTPTIMKTETAHSWFESLDAVRPDRMVAMGMPGIIVDGD